jgi:hypothetical protein
MDTEIVVQPGEIIVNEVISLIDNPEFKVYYVDLRSKYPAGVFYISTENTIAVGVLASEGTLYTDNTSFKPTMVEFRFPDAHNWNVIADAARYTVRIVMWRQKLEYLDD